MPIDQLLPSLGSIVPQPYFAKESLGTRAFHKDETSGTSFELRKSDAALRTQNIFPKQTLDDHQANAVDLRSILCSMTFATLCVSPDLRLRFFTAAAGQLLGLGRVDVGAKLPDVAPLEAQGLLMRRMRAVMRGAVPEDREIEMPTGQRLRCRIRPLHAFEARNPTVDGVIITFVPSAPSRTTPPNPAHGSSPALAPSAPGIPPEPVDGHDGCRPDPEFGLTLRQHQVLAFVLAGCPNKNIAADLGISQRTVENHRAAIMHRTGATSVPALTRLAIGVEIGGDRKTPPPTQTRSAWPLPSRPLNGTVFTIRALRSTNTPTAADAARYVGSPAEGI